MSSGELARMPPKFASGAWRSLLQNPAIDRYRFAESLAAIVSKPVVDTLIYVQFTKPIVDADGNMQSLGTLLNGMAVSSESVEMRDYIRNEVAKHKDSVFTGPTIVD